MSRVTSNQNSFLMSAPVRFEACRKTDMFVAAVIGWRELRFEKPTALPVSAPDWRGIPPWRNGYPTSVPEYTTDGRAMLAVLEHLLETGHSWELTCPATEYRDVTVKLIGSGRGGKHRLAESESMTFTAETAPMAVANVILWLCGAPNEPTA